MTDNTDKYYDKVDDAEHARSAENRTLADPRSRDLWQSTNISTDGSGPESADVAPVFAQARADALRSGEIVNEDAAAEDSDEVKNDVKSAAEAAQEEADRLRNSGGYVAPTGADADIYDDPKNEEAVPSENYSAAPKSDDEGSASSEPEVQNSDSAGSVPGGPTTPRSVNSKSTSDQSSSSDSVDSGSAPADQPVTGTFEVDKNKK